MKNTDFVKALVCENKPGYIKINNSSNLISSILPHFETLCCRPLDYRKRFCTDWKSSQEKGFDPDCGLVWREDDLHDSKIFLHERPNLRSELKRAGITLTPSEDILISGAENLYKICYDEAQEICRLLDKELPGFNFEKQFLVKESSHVLRLLRYSPDREFYAQPHYDVGFMTFAMFNGFLGKKHTEPTLFVEGHGVSLEKDMAYSFLGMKSPVFSDVSLDGDFAKALQDDWNHDFAGLLPHVHHAQSKNTKAVRYAVVFFVHIDVGLSLEEMSLIQKRFL